MMPESTKSSHITRALACAALLLGVAGLVKLLSPAHISPEWAQRVLGALMGCVVVLYANSVPKILAPLARQRCNPAVEQSLRRFCGWSLVLGGAGYVIAWLAAPIAWANLAAAISLGLALCAFLLRCAWSLFRPR